MQIFAPSQRVTHIIFVLYSLLLISSGVAAQNDRNHFNRRAITTKTFSSTQTTTSTSISTTTKLVTSTSIGTSTFTKTVTTPSISISTKTLTSLSLQVSTQIVLSTVTGPTVVVSKTITPLPVTSVSTKTLLLSSTITVTVPAGTVTVVKTAAGTPTTQYVTVTIASKPAGVATTQTVTFTPSGMSVTTVTVSASCSIALSSSSSSASTSSSTNVPSTVSSAYICGATGYTGAGVTMNPTTGAPDCQQQCAALAGCVSYAIEYYAPELYCYTFKSPASVVGNFKPGSAGFIFYDMNCPVTTSTSSSSLSVISTISSTTNVPSSLTSSSVSIIQSSTSSSSSSSSTISAQKCGATGYTGAGVTMKLTTGVQDCHDQCAALPGCLSYALTGPTQYLTCYTFNKPAAQAGGFGGSNIGFIFYDMSCATATSSSSSTTSSSYVSIATSTGVTSITTTLSSTSQANTASSTSSSTISALKCGATGYTGAGVTMKSTTGVQDCHDQCAALSGCLSYALTGPIEYLTCYTFKKSAASAGSFGGSYVGFVFYDMACNIGSSSTSSSTMPMVSTTPYTSTATVPSTTPSTPTTTLLLVTSTSLSSTSSQTQSSSASSSSTSTVSALKCGATGYTGAGVTMKLTTGVQDCHDQCAALSGCLSYALTGPTQYLTCYTFNKPAASAGGFGGNYIGFVFYDMACNIGTSSSSTSTMSIPSTASYTSIMTSIPVTSASSSSTSSQFSPFLSSSSSSSSSTVSAQKCGATGYTGAGVTMKLTTGVQDCHDQCAALSGCLSYALTGPTQYLTCYTFDKPAASAGGFGGNYFGFVFYDISCAIGTSSSSSASSTSSASTIQPTTTPPTSVTSVSSTMSSTSISISSGLSCGTKTVSAPYANYSTQAATLNDCFSACTSFNANYASLGMCVAVGYDGVICKLQMSLVETWPITQSTTDFTWYDLTCGSSSSFSTTSSLSATPVPSAASQSSQIPMTTDYPSTTSPQPISSTSSPLPSTFSTPSSTDNPIPTSSQAVQASQCGVTNIGAPYTDQQITAGSLDACFQACTTYNTNNPKALTGACQSIGYEATYSNCWLYYESVSLFSSNGPAGLFQYYDLSCQGSVSQPVATPAASITGYCGVSGDAAGGWITIADATSIPDCKAKCASQSGCVSYAIFDTTECYLYSTEASVNNIESDWVDGPFTFWDMNCDVGVVPTVYPTACADPSKWQLLSGYSISNVGGALAVVPASNSQDCCASCQSTSNCVTWSYQYSWQEGWVCVLQSSLTNPYVAQATSDACPNGIAKLTGISYMSSSTTYFSAMGPCAVAA